MNVDGSGRTQLTDVRGSDSDPNWSPDGSKIVFTSGREGDSSAIYIMNSDGSGQRPLIPGHRCEASQVVCLGDEYPAWSPDGTMIALVGFPGFSDIFVVNADGTNEKQLTDTPDVFEWSPSWQPVPVDAPASQAPAASATPVASTGPANSAKPSAATPVVTCAATPSPSAYASESSGSSPSPPATAPETPIDTSATAAEPSPEAPSTVTPAVSALSPQGCSLDDSRLLGTREQALALAALGGVAAGSALLLPVAAFVRRSRRRLH